LPTTEGLETLNPPSKRTRSACPLTPVALAIRLIHVASGRVLAGNLEVARTTPERMRGLLGRRGLRPGEGMLIERCSNIHTFFMRFPIDVIFVDGDWNVRKVARAVPPWRMVWAPGARHVIELPSGATDRIPVAPGDAVRIEGPV